LRRRPDLLLVGEVYGNVARSVQDENLVARGGQGRRDATADGPAPPVTTATRRRR
jgi:hypothetical protein